VCLNQRWKFSYRLSFLQSINNIFIQRNLNGIRKEFKWFLTHSNEKVSKHHEKLCVYAIYVVVDQTLSRHVESCRNVDGKLRGIIEWKMFRLLSDECSRRREFRRQSAKNIRYSMFFQFLVDPTTKPLTKSEKLQNLPSTSLLQPLINPISLPPLLKHPASKLMWKQLNRSLMR
jgi:4-alpha-glucanotransferase